MRIKQKDGRVTEGGIKQKDGRVTRSNDSSKTLKSSSSSSNNKSRSSGGGKGGQNTPTAAPVAPVVPEPLPPLVASMNDPVVSPFTNQPVTNVDMTGFQDPNDAVTNPFGNTGSGSDSGGGNSNTANDIFGVGGTLQNPNTKPTGNALTDDLSGSNLSFEDETSLIESMYPQEITDVSPPVGGEGSDKEVAPAPAEETQTTQAGDVPDPITYGDASRSIDVDASKRRRRRAGYGGTILTGAGGIGDETTGVTLLG